MRDTGERFSNERTIWRFNFLPLKSGSPTPHDLPAPSCSFIERCFNFLPLKSGSPTHARESLPMHLYPVLSSFNFLPLKSGSPTYAGTFFTDCQQMCQAFFLQFPAS